MSMVKPSVRVNTSVSLGELLRQRVLSKIVPLLSVLVVVLSAGRCCPAVSHGVTGTKLSAVVKGNIATTAALSVATSKTIVGAFTKIPQGKFAVSAVLSAGTLLFSADEVEAGDNQYGTCRSTNYPGEYCEDVEVQGCGQSQSKKDCCQIEGTLASACDGTSGSDIGCCSCNDESACFSSSNAVFYDNVCNGNSACENCDNIIVYSGSCNNEKSCWYSSYLTVGSNSCNGYGSCSYCCGISQSKTNPPPGVSCQNSNTMIPNNECNDPSIINYVSDTNEDYPYPSCPWCPNCQFANGSSCYNSLLTGQATLSDAGITGRRALQTKKSKQKDKKSKETQMNCVSAMNKTVSYFQGQNIAKFRSKYTSGKLAKRFNKGGHRKRSPDCNIELSWLFEHLEGVELLQACATLENQKTNLQEYLGNSLTIKNLKCVPLDKNKIH